MYKNVLLMRNGCEGCSMETCLGVLLAESLNAKVTAVYVTGNFTWQELRNIYGVDELKWAGAGRDGEGSHGGRRGEERPVWRKRRWNRRRRCVPTEEFGVRRCTFV